MFKIPFLRPRQPRKTYRIKASAGGDSLVISDGAEITVIQARDVRGATLRGAGIRITGADGGLLLELAHARNASAAFDALNAALTSPGVGFTGRLAIPRFVKVAALLVGLYLLIGFSLSTATGSQGVASAAAAPDAAAAYSFEPRLNPVPIEAPKLACGGKHAPEAPSPQPDSAAPAAIQLK